MIASVVVRSYNRVPALCELLAALLAQDHPDFEVVVVEQSTKVPPEAAARLDELARDPRLRILRHPPLGGARARNVGAAAARGDILLFMDDDDLPEGTGWIAAHLANYADPSCLGVSGRHRWDRDGDRVRDSAWAYRRCMRFSPLLRFPLTYVRHGRRKAPVDYVHGTNGSIRRSAFERFGGWDEDTRIEDEASFGFRAARLKEPSEYFCFDPKPVVLRRMGLPGGLDKRHLTAFAFAGRLLDFAHRIIGRYHRARLIAFYPLYLFTVLTWTWAWIWSESEGHSTTPRRLAASLWMTLILPGCAAVALKRLASGAPTGSGTGSPSRSLARAPRSTSP